MMYGTTEDRCGNIIQCGDRVLDSDDVRYVIRKISPPYLLVTRESDGLTVKILISDVKKTRWI